MARKLDERVEDLYVRVVNERRKDPAVTEVLKQAVARSRAILEGKKPRRLQKTKVKLTREQRNHLRDVANAMDERADETYPHDISFAAYEIYIALYHLLGLEFPRPKKEPPWPKNRPLPF